MPKCYGISAFHLPAIRPELNSLAWVDAGRPRVGQLNNVRLACKARYKQAIRVARAANERKTNERLVRSLLDCDSKGFWKGWKKQYSPKSTVTMISGCASDKDICEGFCSTFKKNFKDSNDCTELKRKFIEQYDSYALDNCNSCAVMLTMAEVEVAMYSLKCNKSPGCDGLTVEHLINAGGRLPFLLTKLFNGCLAHGFVPNDFGESVIVPVPKGDASKLGVFDGYRPVSLINIVSKVFEMCVLVHLSKVFVSDELQFGFTSGKGCQKALFVLSCIIEHFNDRGSNVYVAGLDITKAFDSVNHYGIYIKMMEIGVPLCILNTFVNWYAKLSGYVRWAGLMSSAFAMRSGVREGSVVSPLIFSLYIDDLIKTLRLKGFGCYVGNIFAGCLLFADDILLLSASLLQLQGMLDICHDYCVQWDMVLSVKKSNVIVVGRDDESVLPIMNLGSDELCWVKELKYLGVFMQSHKGLRINIEANCRKFLGSAFGIFQKCGYLSEEVLCEIIFTKCLPVLTYGLECFKLLEQQKHKLCVALNTVVRRIFNMSRRTSVRDIIVYAGSKPCDVMLDERHFLLLRECLRSDYGIVRLCGRLHGQLKYVTKICLTYGVSDVLPVTAIKKFFYDFVTRPT
jgi:hypothetical protein